MDKTMAGLLGAVGALVAGASAQAAPASILHADSYAALLRPVPNAVAALAVLDAADQAQVDQVQFGPTIIIGHGDRHDHHRYYRRPRYHHHHHHHHHNGYYRR